MSKEVRSQKLDSIARCLTRIDAHLPKTADELWSNIDMQDIIVLNLERLVQTSVDCASCLIADRGWMPLPDSMASTFTQLSSKGIISPELSARLVKAVGFRNLCVHEYDKINWDIVFVILTKHLNEFRQFASLMDQQH